MPNDPYPHFEFLGQRQLGRYFNASSHEVGRWLKEVGLRDRNGQPTSRAVEEGFAEPVIPEVGKMFYAWDKEKTVKLLANDRLLIGSIPQEAEQAPNMTLVGPFTAHQSSEDGFEVRGADGVVSIWVRGEVNAEVVARTLNFVENHKRLGKL